MSLVPMIFSDWWEDLQSPHRLWDQHFGLNIDPDDLFNNLDNTEILVYRPTKRHRRRMHPFSPSAVRRGRGTSTVQADKNKFHVTLDVGQFSPDEITVKVIDNKVVVEAKHDEKEDQHGWVSRQFVRKYIVPSQCDIEQVESRLSSDGILTITVPRKEPLRSDKNERSIKIQYTGRPAVLESEPTNGPAESQQNEQPQQTPPPRGQQQPQQNQRGRKSSAKS